MSFVLACMHLTMSDYGLENRILQQQIHVKSMMFDCSQQCEKKMKLFNIIVDGRLLVFE